MNIAPKLAVALIALAGPAAALTADTTTELNLRAGPGAQYPVLAVAQPNSTLNVEGCVASGDWCKVTLGTAAGATEAWAYSPYLTATLGQDPVVVYDNIAPLNVQTITYQSVNDGTVTQLGESFGDKQGELIVNGPKAVPGIAPDERTMVFIQQNPVAPIYLDGEVVVGAGIPENVILHPVPEVDYDYANVNGQMVLVDQGSRRIVTVMR
jgi:uncharacterized protein YraI